MTHPQPATAFGVNSYVYGTYGNLASKHDGTATTTYSYDWNDRLSSVSDSGGTIADYTYTEERQRLSKSVGTSTTWYLNNYTEYDGSYDNYIFSKNNRIATDNGTLTYNHPDHLQSSSLETNTTGLVTSSLTYTPFGVEETSTGTKSNDYTFTDQEKDSETGLMYYDSRYYDTDLKRFTSVDPAVIRLGTRSNEMVQLLTDPQQQNTYSYVRNNPVKYNDPTGEILPALALPLAWAFAGAGSSLGITAAVGYFVPGTDFSRSDYIANTAMGSIGGLGGLALKGTSIVTKMAVGGLSAGSYDLYNQAKDNSEIYPEYNYSAAQTGVETAVGTVTGGIPTPNIFSGRNNNSAISQQIITKYNNGNIQNVSASTAMKNWTVEQYTQVVDELKKHVANVVKDRLTGNNE